MLDPETKQYNVSYIKRLMAGMDVVLYPFLKRKQGWMVPAIIQSDTFKQRVEKIGGYEVVATDTPKLV